MIRSIKLANFRNHNKLEIEFSKITILIGPNGAGKTNIIEAIRLLSILKGFRARRQEELIRWGSQVARVIGKADDYEVEVAISDEAKVVKINGVRKAPAQAVGLLKTVLFTPEDVSLFTGPPAQRRRFMDVTLAQGNHHYLMALASYGQLLRRRNRLLWQISQGAGSREELTVWNKQLVSVATTIHEARQALVHQFNSTLPRTHQVISGLATPLALSPRWSAMTTEALQLSLNRDILLGQTTIGPHHDDFSLQLNGIDIGRFGSRGENRTASFTLKIAELNFLGPDSILLLDDIFSELDHERRERLQQLIEPYQTVITTTDEHYIADNLKKTAKIIELN